MTKPYYSPNALRLRAIEDLEQKLLKTTDFSQRQPLIKELRRLRGEQKAVNSKKPKKTPSAKLPKSIREAIKAERERAHGISGFRSIRAHFVQGGKAGGK